MKKLLFSYLISIVFYLQISAQFNESFFETLGPDLSAISGSKRAANFYGIKTNYGALGVRLADSAATEVQWIKSDLNNSSEFFSANLPQDVVSKKEIILNLFELGNNQIIVTKDSNSYASQGIRFHKFLNYTVNDGEYYFPLAYTSKGCEAFLSDGKIYVFFVDGFGVFKRITVDPTTLALENTLILVNDFTIQGNIEKEFKSIHVDFISPSEMIAYTNANSKLVRVKIQNNTIVSSEFEEKNLVKVLAIDTINGQLVCLMNTATNAINNLGIDNTIPISNFQIISSVDLPDAVSVTNDNLMFATDGLNSFLFLNNYRYKAFKMNNNIILDTIKNFQTFFVRNVFINQNELNVFGIRGDNYNNGSTYSGSDNHFFLFLCKAEFNKLFNFREYFTKQQFGDDKVIFGIGSLIFPFSKFYKTDYLDTVLFDKTIFNVTQAFVGGLFPNKKISNYFNMYKPGPYTETDFYDQNIVNQYNESFYIDNQMVWDHISNYTNSSYQIPNSILNWPAHGNPSIGQAQNLAPFVDVNGNQMYEPLLGEYPSFPGSTCMMNITHQHQSDQDGLGDGLELHTYLYRFDCDDDTIQNVLFLKTEVYNRGDIQYDSLFAGISADFDVGSYNNDYAGTHVENGLIYAYNSDSLDPITSFNPYGFLDSIPTIGIQLLKGVKFENNGVDDQAGFGENVRVNGYGFGDGIADNEFKGLEYSTYFTSTAQANFSDPTIESQWKNYFTGRWRYGDTVYFGAQCLNQVGNVTNLPTRFVCPDDSDPLFFSTDGIDPGFNWSEVQSNNATGDRRIMGSFGSTSLPVGSKYTFHSALMGGKRAYNQNTSLQDLFAKAAYVKTAFGNNSTACGQSFDNLDASTVSVEENKINNLTVNIYPNPFKDQLQINVINFDQQTTLKVYTISGIEVLKAQMKENSYTIENQIFVSGVYFISIENSFGKTVKKVIRL
jgi:hypothetical protein